MCAFPILPSEVTLVLLPAFVTAPVVQFCKCAREIQQAYGTCVADQGSYAITH